MSHYLEDEIIEFAIEGMRAFEKFGAQDHLGELDWLAIIAEEFGEATKDVTQLCVPPITGEHSRADLRAEIVQIGATAARWLHAFDRRDSSQRSETSAN